jgi:hypothetical protein
VSRFDIKHYQNARNGLLDLFEDIRWNHAEGNRSRLQMVYGDRYIRVTVVVHSPVKASGEIMIDYQLRVWSVSATTFHDARVAAYKQLKEILG